VWCESTSAFINTGSQDALRVFAFTLFTATDHLGRSSTAQSPGLTIDSTPPDVTTVPIDVGQPYITQRTHISASWNGVFDDPESGEKNTFSWILFVTLKPC